MSEDWKAGLRLELEELVDRLVGQGARQDDVFDAIADETAALRMAHQQDPDPADAESEIIDEPANDWPSADGPA